MKKPTPITDRTAAILLALATQQMTPTELREALFVQIATEGTIAQGLAHRLLFDTPRHLCQETHRKEDVESN